LIKKTVAFLLILLIWILIKFGMVMSLIEWINSSFMTGLIFLLVSVFAFILKTGFLSLFFKGFQAIGSMITPKPRAMERTDEMLENDYKLQEFKMNMSTFIFQSTLLIGISSIAVSVIGLIFYL
jgi:hypothetical protein